jgi:alpha-L-rhamnosidase
MLPDGSINPGEMTSFNHYALGAVADWLHRTVAGLAPVEPGYRRIAIQPRPGGGLSHASAQHLTPYGIAKCAWTIQDGKMEIEVIVPPNATASVRLPGMDGKPVEVESGTHNWSYAYQDPDVRQPLSMDSTISEISNDPDAWTAVTETLTRLVPQNVFIVDMLQSRPKRSLRDALAKLPSTDALRMAIVDALAEIEQKSWTDA